MLVKTGALLELPAVFPLLTLCQNLACGAFALLVRVRQVPSAGKRPSDRSLTQQRHSNLSLLGQLQRIVHLNTQMAHGTFELRMT